VTRIAMTDGVPHALALQLFTDTHTAVTHDAALHVDMQIGMRGIDPRGVRLGVRLDAVAL